MNIILNPQQSDTKREDISLIANANLTGCEGLMWKVVNNGGVANFALPAAITDLACFVGASGDVQGNLVAAESPSQNDTFRVIVDSAVLPGQQLSLSPNNWGRLYVPAGGSGATVGWAIALESAAAGGLCKCVRIGPNAFTP